MGRTPSDGGAALLARLRRESSASVHRHDRVAVASADAELIRSALGESGVVVEVDASLQPGEAHLAGDWSSASLTLSGLVDEMRAQLRSADAEPAEGEGQ